MFLLLGYPILRVLNRLGLAVFPDSKSPLYNLYGIFGQNGVKIGNFEILHVDDWIHVSSLIVLPTSFRFYTYLLNDSMGFFFGLVM